MASGGPRRPWGGGGGLCVCCHCPSHTHRMGRLRAWPSRASPGCSLGDTPAQSHTAASRNPPCASPGFSADSLPTHCIFFFFFGLFRWGIQGFI